MTWGADREILFHLYAVLVLSKMDYGCVVYFSARRSYLKKLNSVHNAGVRYAHMFRTIPAQSLGLYCKAGMTCLDLRHQMLLLTYVAKILALPNHKNHVFLANTRLDRVYDHHSTFTRPGGIRALEIAHIEAPMVQAYVPCKVPPWPVSYTHLDVYKRQAQTH